MRRVPPVASWPVPDLTEPHAIERHPTVIRAAAITGPVALVRSSRGRQSLQKWKSAWSPWAAFCRYHGLDPDAPTDDALVAFVEARVWAGVGYSIIRSSLITVELAVTGSETPGRLTVAARRWLTLLHDEGLLEGTVRQAPVLSVGEIIAVARASGVRPRLEITIRKERLVELLAARDQLLVVWTYLLALRSGEWTWIDLEHVWVDDDRVEMLLPTTKTGEWQLVTLRRSEDFDPVTLLKRYLDLRGREPGPLLVDSWGELYRMTSNQISYALRAAAAHAGQQSFSPYSLRRSRATHAFLQGDSQTQIRRLLRHRSRDTWRRYVESSWAMWDIEQARVLYLSTDVPVRDPVPIAQVRSSEGEGSRPTAGMFRGGPIHGLLDGIDVAALVVPEDLAERTQAGLDDGASRYAAFLAWCEEQGWTPDDEDSLSVWLAVTYADVVCAPSTVQRAAADVAIGWSLINHASRSSWEAWREAEGVIEGLSRMKGATHEAQSRSRTAVEGDLAAVLALEAVPDRPVAWAINVLRTVCGEGVRIELLEVGPDTVVIRRNGRRVSTLGRSDLGEAMCPVAASEVLLDAERTVIDADEGQVGWEAVFTSAAAYTQALRDELTILLEAASGGRASDVARAPRRGVEHIPGGTVCWLNVRKGHRGEVEQEYLWVPEGGIDGHDVQDRLIRWLAWCPWPDGPLLPALDDVASLAAGRLVPQHPDDVTAMVQGRIDAVISAGTVEEGLTAYGWRYRFAADALRRGVPVGAVADAMGHSDEATTIGYAQRVDPFLVTNVAEIYEQLARGVGS